MTEPAQDKTYNKTCATSEDSDQSAHLLSLFIVFASTAFRLSITKTCLYNFDPLKNHFYIVKLEFTGVYIIFLISAQNLDCGYSFEPPLSKKKITRTYMQKHTMTDIVIHSRSTALEPLVKYYCGGLKRFYVATTFARSPGECKTWF